MGTPVVTALAALVVGFAGLAGARFRGRTEVSDKFRVRVFGGKAKIRARHFQPEFSAMFQDVVVELTKLEIPPGGSFTGEALEAVVGRAEWVARISSLNAWLTQEGNLDRAYARLKSLQGWIVRLLALLSAWCLVGDLGAIFLLVSGRWADDWVGFVAGGFGALFLGAVVVVFVTGISAYPHLELAHRELLHRITSFLQSAAGSSWAGPGRKLRVSAGAAWVRSATDSLRFEARMAIREYTYDGTDSSVRWSSDCVGKSGPIASACSESNTAHEFVQRRRQRRQATPGNVAHTGLFIQPSLRPWSHSASALACRYFVLNLVVMLAGVLAAGDCTSVASSRNFGRAVAEQRFDALPDPLQNDSNWLGGVLN